MLSTRSPSLYAPLPTQPQRTGWCTMNNILPPFDSLQSTEHDWSLKQCTHLPALYVLFPWQQDLLYLLSSQLEPYPKTSEVPWHYFQEQAPEMKGKNQWFSHILFSNWHCISEAYHYNFKFKGFLPYQLRHRELVGALIKPNDRHYNNFLMIEDLYGSYDSWIQIIQSVRIIQSKNSGWRVVMTLDMDAITQTWPGCYCCKVFAGVIQMT